MATMHNAVVHERGQDDIELTCVARQPLDEVRVGE